MKITKGVQLFFGCKIDSKLRDALAQARPGDRRYFEDPNSEFLRVCQVGEERWIGKVMNGGVSVTEVEDIQRNIVSILRRIAPNVRTPVSSLKIFAIEAEGEVVESEPVGVEEEPPVGGGGPYIDY
jgi:hypothetical protein